MPISDHPFCLVDEFQQQLCDAEARRLFRSPLADYGTLSVKFHLRERRTASLRRSVVRSFVCLFVRCVCQRRPSYKGTKRDVSYKFKGDI